MATEGQAAAPAATAPAAADPVSRIQAMLVAENAPPPQEPAEAAPAEESPAEDYQPGENKGEEGADAPVEESAESAGSEEPKATAEIPLDQLEAIELEIKVKGDDGKDVIEKPTIKELREGYMRQKDYSRKTAEVARQREEVGNHVRQAVETERTQYKQNLEMLQAMVIETVAPELKNVDWNTLAQNDAFEYVRLRNRADQITQAIGQIQSKTTELTAKQQAEQQAALRTQAAKSREILEQKIPGWNDSLYQSLMKAGESYGYSSEEVGKWLDPRSLQVLHDAHQYRMQKAGQKPPSTDKKVVSVPKVVKPGANQAQLANQQRAAEARTRLQKSGSIQDAAELIRARLG